MSSFDNHHERLAALDREILHYAALCNVNISDHAAIHGCLAHRGDSVAEEKQRETLQGLLLLRLKLEEEMLRLGMIPPELGGW